MGTALDTAYIVLVEINSEHCTNYYRKRGRAKWSGSSARPDLWDMMVMPWNHVDLVARWVYECSLCLIRCSVVALSHSPIDLPTRYTSKWHRSYGTRSRCDTHNLVRRAFATFVLHHGTPCRVRMIVLTCVAVPEQKRACSQH